MKLARKLMTVATKLRKAEFSGLHDALSLNLKLMFRGITGITVNGCNFMLPGLPEEFLRTIVKGDYERSERELITHYLDPDSPVVELGGCLGIISCIANQLLREPRKHIVVEASKALATLIRNNADRNGCSLSIEQAAIAYDAPSVSFWVNPKHPYSSALVPIHEGAEEIVVPTITLETILYRYQINHCTLICDIEGQEYEFVRNELALIAQHARLIVMETHPNLIGRQKTNDMLASLARVGFQTLEVRNDVHVLQRPE